MEEIWGGSDMGVFVDGGYVDRDRFYDAFRLEYEEGKAGLFSKPKHYLYPRLYNRYDQFITIDNRNKVWQKIRDICDEVVPKPRFRIFGSDNWHEVTAGFEFLNKEHAMLVKLAYE